MRNTIKQLKTKSGKIIYLTLTFEKLLELKNISNAIYEKFMEILNKEKIDDMFDYVIIIYTAYLCANINNTKEIIKYKDFLKEIHYDYQLINMAYTLIRPKKKDSFRKTFKNKTKRIKNVNQVPKFILEDIEDYYTFYVLILNINEEIFWNCDYSFVLSIVENREAFNNYIDFLRQKEKR